MKKLLLTLLLLFSLGFAAQADETPYLSLTFGSHNTKKVQDYTSNWEQTIGEFTWAINKLNNNNNGWDYVRFGPKNTATETTASIATKSAIDKPISKITTLVKKAQYGEIKSIYLEVASNANFSDKETIQTASTIPSSNGAESNIEFFIENPTAEKFYRVAYTFTNNKSKNGVGDVVNVYYYASADPTITTTPAGLKEGEAESNAVAMGQEVTFTAENVAEGTEIEVLSEYDDDAVFVDGSYTATITKDGMVLITIGEAEFTYNFTVDQTAKKDAGIAFAAESVELYQGEKFVAPALINPNELTVTLGSDNEEVAKIVGGAVVLAGAAGTATITATSAETEEYAEGEASYTITVKAAATCIADMIELAPNKNDKVYVNCPLTITYVNGLYVYAADEAGDGMLLYGSYSVEAGDVIPAGWEATNSWYNGLLEWKGTIPTSTGKAEVEYEMVENVALSDINKVVVLKAVAFDEATPSAGSNNFTGTLLVGTTLKFRTNWDLESVPAGVYNVTCAVSYFEKNATEATDAANIQIVPISYEDVSTKVNGLSYRVSLADDGTVTVKYDVHVKNHYDGNEYKLLVKIDEGEAEEIVLGEPVEVSPAEGAPMRKPVSNTSGDTEGATHVISGTSDLQQKITADAGSTFNVHMAVHVNGEEAHAMEEPAVYTVTTGIADVAVEGQDADAEYFNLQGVRVAQPQAGSIYIVRRAGRVSKELVK